MSKKYKILLYYKYIKIDDPAQLRVEQKELCQRLNLKGRVLIADEGINGTLAGEEAAVNEYQAVTESNPYFSDIEWKISAADEQVFPKLRVVLRDEIVTLGAKKQGPDVALENKAYYIEPEELLTLLESNEELILIDARNDYEVEVGKFKNALIPPIRNFREFPGFVNSLPISKDAQVVTYCTGGIRCEKASAYLREQGFSNVRQLHGGIHDYGVKAGGKYFEGEMFVFDKRLHVPVNQINPSVTAHCVHCELAITRYIDCPVLTCDSLFSCCEPCEKAQLGACSTDCQENLAVTISQSMDTGTDSTAPGLPVAL